MKTLIPFLFFFSLSINLSGQWFAQFSTIENTPCFGDPNTIITQPENWTIYQTLEDTWDGTIDSSICINTTIGTTNVIVPINQIDTSRSVFIRYSFDESNKVLLEKDNIYALTTSFTADGFALNQDSDCSNNLCTGSIVGIQFQNEDATDFNVRYHLNGAQSENHNSCIATEPFPENWLRTYIFKFTVNSAINITIDASFSLYTIYLENNFFQNDISEANIPEYTFTGDAYEVPLETLQDPSSYNYAKNYLALNTSWPDVYPGPMNIHYIDATLNPNQAEQATINIHIQNYESLSFQAFTQFRGGLIEDSDSIRHNVNLIQNGGNLCLESFVEIVIPDDRKFIYKSGQIDLYGQSACMQIRGGGLLEIASGSSLHYGQNGQGMLLLKTGGSILFNEDSHLEINNSVKLRSYHPNLTNLESNQIFIDLPLNSSLKFGRQARIFTHEGEEDFMRLNINMHGGEIDLSNLDEESRSYINLIYPEASIDPSENLFILPNPTAGPVQLKWNGMIDEQVQIQIFDLQGRLIKEEAKKLLKGANLIDLSYSTLPSGLYILCLDSPSQGKVVQKLAINR